RGVAREGREGEEGCPGWDSNPHWIGFEPIASAGWATGARGPSNHTRRSGTEPSREAPGGCSRGCPGESTEGRGASLGARVALVTPGTGRGAPPRLLGWPGDRREAPRREARGDGAARPAAPDRPGAR